MTKIAIPINSQLIGEMFLRGGPKSNISDWIENIIESYLDRTADDGGWEDAYYDYIVNENSNEEFGDPRDGYRWGSLFLPNGTKIYMIYKNEKSQAVVKFSKIYFNNETYSPSQFAKAVASNTIRNAWRDLYIKRPQDIEWTLADSLRQRLMKS